MTRARFQLVPTAVVAVATLVIAASAGAQTPAGADSVSPLGAGEASPLGAEAPAAAGDTGGVGTQPSREGDGGSQTGGTGPGDEGDGGGDGGSGITLVEAEVRPGKIFLYGKRDATFRYVIDAPEARALTIKLVRRKNDRVIRTWNRAAVEPGVADSVRWNGRRDGGGHPGNGKYAFRVLTAKGERVTVAAEAQDRKVFFYKYKFPILGPHTYGDGIGAPRGDHTHRGQDLAADCGTPLVAVRGGTVQWKAYQSGGAGYYIVLDAKGNGRDYVYMHLDGPARVAQGERVATGERIGSVGTSGSSTGCHLHFEIWSAPGWYEGGEFTDPLDDLLKWDSWS